jgi:hypothetical protein
MIMKRFLTFHNVPGVGIVILTVILFLTQPFEVLNTTGLPTGDYAFYFAVYTLADGLLDLSAVSYDATTVQVVEQAAKSGAYPVVDTGQESGCGNNFQVEVTVP